MKAERFLLRYFFIDMLWIKKTSDTRAVVTLSSPQPQTLFPASGFHFYNFGYVEGTFCMLGLKGPKDLKNEKNMDFRLWITLNSWML